MANFIGRKESLVAWFSFISTIFKLFHAVYNTNQFSKSQYLWGVHEPTGDCLESLLRKEARNTSMFLATCVSQMAVRELVRTVCSFRVASYSQDIHSGEQSSSSLWLTVSYRMLHSSAWFS